MHIAGDVTHPRIIASGATFAVTRRTTLRKMFLAPWHPEVSAAWLYALADAQADTGIAVHLGNRVLTHHHLTVTVDEPNLPDFLKRVHHDISCALNTLLARERYDAPGELFDKRSSHCMRVVDAPAQATQLVYDYNNGVAAGLVQRPEHMPGYVFDFDLWRRGSLEVKRPDFYFSKNRPETLELIVTPPPALYAAFGGDLDKLIYHMKRMANASGMALRAAQKRPVVGAEALTQIHPWDEPKTLRERGGRLVPSFRIGARGIVGRQLYHDAVEDTRNFRRRHEAARQARLAGNLEEPFPYATYLMRVLHKAPVEPPPPPGVGVVTCPGETLAQVKARLERERAERAARAEQLVQAEQASAHVALVQEATAALVEEAESLIEDASAELGELREPSPPPATGSHAGRAERRPSLTRHRFSKRLSAREAQSVRRVITLRDKRSRKPGRPKRPEGSDPPA